MGGELLGIQMTGGTLNPLPPNASREDQINALNDVINRLNAQLKSQTFSDGTSKRYLNGYLANGWPGGDFGMRISAPGYDVTDPSAVLIFSWDYTTNRQVVYTNGIPTALIGTHPVNQNGGIWSAPSGKNVITLLGG